MATKKVTKLYSIIYNDGMVMHYRFTKDEYSQIAKAIGENWPYADTSVGLIVPKDIRSVILQVEKAVEQHEGAGPEMTDEEKSWIEAARVAERIAKDEAGMLDEDGAEVDYIGGMI